MDKKTLLKQSGQTKGKRTISQAEAVGVITNEVKDIAGKNYSRNKVKKSIPPVGDPERRRRVRYLLAAILLMEEEEQEKYQHIRVFLVADYQEELDLSGLSSPPVPDLIRIDEEYYIRILLIAHYKNIFGDQNIRQVIFTLGQVIRTKNTVRYIYRKTLHRIKEYEEVRKAREAQRKKFNIY